MAAPHVFTIFCAKLTDAVTPWTMCWDYWFLKLIPISLKLSNTCQFLNAMQICMRYAHWDFLLNSCPSSSCRRWVVTSGTSRWTRRRRWPTLFTWWRAARVAWTRKATAANRWTKLPDINHCSSNSHQQPQWRNLDTASGNNRQPAPAPLSPSHSSETQTLCCPLRTNGGEPRAGWVHFCSFCPL